MLERHRLDISHKAHEALDCRLESLTICLFIETGRLTVILRLLCENTAVILFCRSVEFTNVSCDLHGILLREAKLRKQGYLGMANKFIIALLFQAFESFYGNFTVAVLLREHRQDVSIREMGLL